MEHFVITTDRKMKNLYKLHQISRTWISEMSFIHDEQHFYQDLVLTYFIDLLKNDVLTEVLEIERRLDKAIQRGNLLMLDIRTHEKQLATLLESEHLKGEKEFRKKHKELADKFERCTQTNKTLKQMLFKLIKNILHEHKQKLLLSHNTDVKNA